MANFYAMKYVTFADIAEPARPGASGGVGGGGERGGGGGGGGVTYCLVIRQHLVHI